MSAVNEQRELANEVAEAISTGGYANADFDEVTPLHFHFAPSIVLILTITPQDELKRELEDLEQEELNDRLMGADHVPVHQPAQKAAERKHCCHFEPTPAG